MQLSYKKLIIRGAAVVKKYYQGTLDYACGIYAVINALALTHNISLQSARGMFQRTIEHFACEPVVWKAFMNNYTDHYWVVAYMLNRWCVEAPYKLNRLQPFSSCFLHHCYGDDTPQNSALYPFASLPDDFTGTPLYLGKEDAMQHDGQKAIINTVTEQMWKVLQVWFGEETLHKRSALLRFHRFLPSVTLPVVSHWTTLLHVEDNCIELHDASADKGSVHVIYKEDTLWAGTQPPSVGLVPASLVLLEKSS